MLELQQYRWDEYEADEDVKRHEPMDAEHNRYELSEREEEQDDSDTCREAFVPDRVERFR